MIGRGRLWIWGAIFCILFVALYLVREVLLPFIAGMAVAYFLDPILDRLEKCRLSRLMATIILTTTFFTLIIALITIIVPLIQCRNNTGGYVILELKFFLKSPQ